MASPRTSKFQFFLPDGTLLAGPAEWSPCLVSVDHDPVDYERLTVSRNGQPLEPYVRRLGGASRVVIDWPRSGAGRYTLHGSCPAWEARCAVTVEPEKITRDAFDCLVEDLQQRLPATRAIAL